MEDESKMTEQSSASAGKETNKSKKKLQLLKNLLITPPPPCATQSLAPEEAAEEEYDFSDVFGSIPVAPTPSSASSRGNHHLPEVIFARAHSLVGPSPRFPHSPSPFSFSDAAVAEDDEEEEVEEGKGHGEGEGGKRVGPLDFEILRVVGQGAFGKVFLVRNRVGDGGDGDVFAMKVMRKETIIRRNQVEYMIAERDILTRINHPFIVQLRYSFQFQFNLKDWCAEFWKLVVVKDTL